MPCVLTKLNMFSVNDADLKNPVHRSKEGIEIEFEAEMNKWITGTDYALSSQHS